MASGGLTYGATKAIFASVVENGTCADDVRVMPRTNEAIFSILSEMIPVNGMATYDVVASGTTLLLPKELENAIEVEVQGMGEVNSQTDVVQGWYAIVNPFTYVDPSAAHDNPLIDEYLQPDPGDPTILRRQYEYPWLTANATVRVTGAKRYIPITQDSDYLLVQNPLAIKYMIQSIERAENNDLQNSEIYHKKAIDLLTAEVKKHQLDPINSMKRKANWDADLINFAPDTYGWSRAMMAFMLPGGLSLGKSEISRFLDLAEMRLIGKGQWVGTIQEFTANVTGGHILTPVTVQTILMIDECGQPIDVKSLFLEYIKNGPGKFCGCSDYLIDEGEMQYPNGDRRRQYLLRNASSTEERCISFVAKLRYVKKVPTDFMTIKNVEALKFMCMAVQLEQMEKWQEAAAAQQNALNEVEHELREYLAGQSQVVNIQVLDLGGCGGIL